MTLQLAPASSVVESHHFDAVPAKGKKNNAAPAQTFTINAAPPPTYTIKNLKTF
jgi:hypothetical protein